MHYTFLDRKFLLGDVCVWRGGIKRNYAYQTNQEKRNRVKTKTEGMRKRERERGGSNRAGSRHIPCGLSAAGVAWRGFDLWPLT